MTNAHEQNSGDGTSRVAHTKGCLGRAARNAVRIVPIAAEFIPTDTKRGFGDGYEAVNGLAEHIPYAVGATAGFAYGAVESVVSAVAVPAMMLVGLGAWVYDKFCPAEAVAEGAGANEIAAELPIASAQ